MTGRVSVTVFFGKCRAALRLEKTLTLALSRVQERGRPFYPWRTRQLIETECGSANLVIPFNNQHPFLLNQPPPKPTLKGEAKTLLAFFVNFPILLSNLIDGFVQLA